MPATQSSNTVNYTVKARDGFLSLARFIFGLSPRPYIKGLVKRHDLMKEAAEKIEIDLKREYPDFKLKVGQVLTLHSDPGYYIKRLATVANHGTLTNKAKTKTKSVTQNDNYFVIHSTEGNLKDSVIEKFKTDKKTGAGHAYINKEGTVISLWAYNSKNDWATRSERTQNKADLRGKLVNIELVYGNKEEPTEKQYQALADIYLETQKLFKMWLPIAAHREIDRGIKGGHQDPVGFKFDHFYSILKTKGVPIDTIDKQSQARFNQAPWCEHKWSWPPVLSGMTFTKLTDKEYIAKGCK